MKASFVLLPRLKCHDEHVDDHQLLFAQAVEQFGVNYCTKFSSLANFVKQPPQPLQKELFDAPSLGKYFRDSYHLKPALPRERNLVDSNLGLCYD